MEVGLSPGDFVLDRDPDPFQKGGGARGRNRPIFGPCLFWPNGLMHQDATWCGGRPHPRRLCVKWGPSPLPQKGEPTQFLAHVYCGQMAAWSKMPLGTEVGRGLRNIVFDVDPTIHRKRAHPPPPNFGPWLLWPNGWMDEDAASNRSRPRPSPHCIRWGPSSPRKGTAAPVFSAHVYCGHGRPSQLLLSSCCW